MSLSETGGSELGVCSGQHVRSEAFPALQDSVPGASEGCTPQPSTTGWMGQAGGCAFRELPCPGVRFGTKLRTPLQTAPPPGILPAVLDPSLPVGSHIYPVQQIGAGLDSETHPAPQEGGREVRNNWGKVLGGIITSQARGVWCLSCPC